MYQIRGESKITFENITFVELSKSMVYFYHALIFDQVNKIQLKCY